jgi:hypothetical protein
MHVFPVPVFPPSEGDYTHLIYPALLIDLIDGSEASANRLRRSQRDPLPWVQSSLLPS